MKGTLARLSVLGLLLGGVLSLPLTALAQKEIVIGATLPITGPFAGSGLQTYQGLQFAEEQINATGGINGNKLRIQVEDTQASNSTAVNAFLKLESQNLPFIFLSSYTVQNLATEPEVLKAKVPVMYAGGGVGIAAKKNPYMFRIRAGDQLRVKGAVESVLDVLKKKKIAIENIQDQYGTAAAEQTKKLLEERGAQVVTVQTHGARDTDFAPQLLNIKNAGAEAMIVFGYIRDVGLMIKQRHDLGLTGIPLVSISSVNEDSMLELVSLQDLQNVYGVADAVLGSANPNGSKSVQFAKEFKDKFKVTPDGFGSVYYDGGMIAFQALKEVGPDREKIRAYLAGLKGYQGVTGTYTTAKNGDMLHRVSIVEFIPGTKDVRVVKDVTE